MCRVSVCLNLNALWKYYKNIDTQIERLPVCVRMCTVSVCLSLNALWQISQEYRQTDIPLSW